MPAETPAQTATRIISRAFLNYPLMLYAFEGRTEQQRAYLLYKLFEKCVSACVLYGKLLLTHDKTGSVIWLPGKNFRPTLPQEIRSGMALIPLQVGVKTTLRLMYHDSEAEGWIKKHAVPNMGYIWNIGVLPEAQGKGYSRLLIDQSIEQMRQEGLTECWLKTEDAKNVTIYQKLGFTVMNQMVVKSSGISSWAMRKMV